VINNTKHKCGIVSVTKKEKQQQTNTMPDNWRSMNESKVQVFVINNAIVR